MNAGVVLWEGASRLNRAPIVVIATGLLGNSTNGKTGGMVQTWILHRDISPGEAVRTGEDAAICGDCIHRVIGGLGSCYVNVGWGPTRIWKSYHEGLYPKITRSDRARIRQQRIRIGAYGDPVAAPASTWRSILPEDVHSATGYTHLWRSRRAQPYGAFLMASVETVAEAREARERGWRCFLVLPHTRPVPDGFRWCPSDALNPARKIPCERCGACNGLRGNTKRDIAIYAHGASGTTFSPQRERNSLVQLPKPHLTYDPLVRMDRDLHTIVKAHCQTRGAPMKRWVDAAVRDRLAAEAGQASEGIST